MKSPDTPEGQSKSQFSEAILENLAEGVVACDANGILTHFNRATRIFHGLPEAPIPAAEWAKHYNLFRADGTTPLAMEEVPLFRALSGESVRDVEMVIKTRDGSRTVLCNGQAIFDDSGKKMGAVVAMHDVTQTKLAKAEQHRALSESEKRFRTLFEQSPLSVQLLSIDGRTLKVNEAWKSLWGVDDTFVNEFLLKKYIILEDPQLIEKGIMPYLKAGFEGHGAKIPAMNYEPSETAAVGRSRWVEAYIEPIFDEEGRVREVVLIHQDVTDKIQSEIDIKAARFAAEEASRLKTAFLANMSHEIRTPLAAVLGFSQLLKDRQLPIEESESYLEVIERSGRSLMQIIDDILDLSKVEAGRLKLEVVPTDINALINEVALLFKVQILEKNLRLRLELLPENKSCVQTDAARIRQILINLVGNAIKFTALGDVSISAQVLSDKLRISVRDTGIGIEPNLRTHLFQPFNQLDNSRTRKFGGTGLGLALSKRLAQALGGDVTLGESAPNVGSTFVVTLPFSPAIENGARPTKDLDKKIESTSDSLNGIHVLLVDDSEDNRMFITLVLQKKGATVTEARNGQEALLLAVSTRFDIIIMDVQMPVMDGNEATRMLRKNGNLTPILALTAHAMIEEREKCIAAGANMHLAKPVQIEALVDTIIKLVRRP